jgi:hypothetical protein
MSTLSKIPSIPKEVKDETLLTKDEESDIELPSFL